MKRLPNGPVIMLVTIVFSLLASACSMNRRAAETPANKQSNEATKSAEDAAAEAAKLAEANKTGDPTPSNVAKESEGSAALSVGQASGTYTSKGETVELKYAYAGRGKRFGQDHESIIVLVTDKPIPAEAVATEIKSQDMLFDQKIRGLEYVIQPNNESFWVCFHPTQYQESKSGSSLKEFSVNQDIVSGHDENDGDLTDGKYKISVRFKAAIIK
ncbi:MAG TPA: hypothetical protein VFD48_00500 [Pyrinomonadaceae bacterium]|nr:hypothetical protein [Pyrinomonadaceae bacterium]